MDFLMKIKLDTIIFLFFCYILTIKSLIQFLLKYTEMLLEITLMHRNYFGSRFKSLNEQSVIIIFIHFLKYHTFYSVIHTCIYVSNHMINYTSNMC